MSKVSIIIPVYNAEKSLKACLDSILKQSHNDFEVLLVNDGSTDNSLAICEEYCKADERFTVITQKNAGPAAARNTGIDRAVGDYIAFVDSDDHIEPSMLSELLTGAEGSDADITVYGYNIVRDDKTEGFACRYTPGVYRGEDCLRLATESIDIHTKSNIPPYSWVRFVRADFLKGLDLRFDPSVYRSEDYLYWVQVQFKANCVCLMTDRLLYNYIDNAGSITHKYVKGYWDMAKKIYTRLSSVLPKDKETLSRLNNMLVHRSLIALNISSRCSDKDRFKAEIKEIIRDPLLQSILKGLGFSRGFRSFKFYYILAKLKATPIIIKRYQLKQK